MGLRRIPSPHLGCQILSYSKRLMNKVMSLADDNDINIYYTDTDSIHIDESGVEPLAKLYEDKYGQKLIGKRLGQFHCDFECHNVHVMQALDAFMSRGIRDRLSRG